MYIIHANLCFVREIQTEYKPNTNRGEAEVCMMVCISRTSLYHIRFISKNVNCLAGVEWRFVHNVRIQ